MENGQIDRGKIPTGPNTILLNGRPVSYMMSSLTKDLVSGVIP